MAHKLTTVAVVISLSTLVGGVASADMDVTGIYHSTLSCKGVSEFFEQKYKTIKNFEISQIGTHLNVTVDGYPASGNLMPLAESPDGKAWANVIGCGINDGLAYSRGSNHLSALIFKAKNGAIKFSGTYVEGAASGMGFTLVCKIKGERTHTFDPGVAACP